MKENIKTVILLTLFFLLSFFLIKTNRLFQESPVTSPDKPETVYLKDTITNVVYDTVFLLKYKTVKLPNTDTNIVYLTDTITRVDSIEVEIPISSYHIDTTITTDSTTLNLFLRNSGYLVELDTLIYDFKYTPTIKKKSFRENFKFGVGISTGYGLFQKEPDVFIGVGFYYCF